MARVMGAVDSMLGVVDGVTAVEVKATAAVVGGGVTVGGGCFVVVVVVVVVVVAATVGDTWVIFLVGGGMVDIGGLNLMTQWHEFDMGGKQKTRKKARGKQN